MRLLIALGLLLLVQPASAAFPDTKNHPNRAAIDFVQSAGIVSGYPDGTYRPDHSINRAEFTKILLGATEEDVSALCRMSTFSDAPLSAWYGRYVHKARCSGIVDGYSDGSFRPSATVNLAEAAKIVVNAFAIPLEQVPSHQQWYVKYLGALHKMNALPPSVKHPSNPLTRSQMAEMIYRVMRSNGGQPSNLLNQPQITTTPASSSPCTTEPQYLSFQVFTYAAMLADRSGQAWDLMDPSPEETVSEINEILASDKHVDPCNILAFSFGPLALDHSDEQMRDVIQRAFALGKKHDVAVSIHIDDSMFWKNRDYLWKKEENVEWTDWNRTIHEERSIG